MFRWLSYAIDFIAGLAVLCAPVIILHWVLTVFNLQQLSVVTQPLDGVMAPLIRMAEATPIPWPTTMVGQKTISVAQLGVGLGGIIVFFLLSLFSSLLRQLEVVVSQQGSAARYASNQAAKRQDTLKQEALQQARLSGSSVLLVHFPFETFREALKLVSASQGGGSMVVQQGDTCILQFPQPEPALHAATSMLGKLVVFAQQHGSFETPPAARIVLHTASSAEMVEARKRCEYVLQYCQPNQVLFTQQLFLVMQAQNIDQNFNHFSTGVYSFPGGAAQDIYQLDVPLPGRDMLY